MLPAFVSSRANDARTVVAALTAVGGFDVRVEPPDALQRAVRAAAASGVARILVAGGDGMVSSAANALVHSRVELAIVPSGTLNHVARHLQLPLDPLDAARLALAGRSRPVDGAYVNDRFFLNTSSVGAYVRFVRLRDRLERRLGYHIASLLAAARLLIRLPLFSVALTVVGERREYLTPLVFIGVGERELRLPLVGARVGGGDARGGLHVMVVRRRSGARAVALGLAAAARGVRHVSQTPAMDAFLVDECRIVPHIHRIAVDGEIVAEHAPLDYRYAPRALHVVAP